MVDSLHQPDVALIDKVLQRQGAALVLFGHADHKAQVGTHEPFLGTLCLRTFSMELAAQLSLLIRSRDISLRYTPSPLETRLVNLLVIFSSLMLVSSDKVSSAAKVTKNLLKATKCTFSS